MKALTICQPFAHLIVTPETRLPAGAVRKRVENRSWPTHYRGELLIHAGKSLDWLMPGQEDEFPGMAFGALVGVARLVDCVYVLATLAGNPVVPPAAERAYPWLADHVHASGPYLWILDDARPFDTPLPYRGAQGLFDVPDDVVFAELVNLGYWSPDRPLAKTRGGPPSKPLF